MTLSFFTDVLRRRFWLVVPAGIALGTLTVCAVLYLFEPLYRAQAWLRVSSRSPYVAFSEPTQYPDPFVLTQIELLHNPLVLETALALPELADLPQVKAVEAPVQWLAKNLIVRQLGQSELLEVTLETTDPKASAAIVNSVIEAYTKLQTNESASSKQRLLELLEEEKQHRSIELDKLRAKLTALIKEHPELATLEKGGASAKSQINELENRLISAEVERELVSAQLNSEREVVAAGKVDLGEATIEAALDKHPQVRRLADLIFEKEAELAEGKSVAAKGQTAAFEGQVNKELASHRAQLAELRAQLRPAVIAENTASLLSKKREDLAKLENDLVAHKARADRLREQVEEERQRSGRSTPAIVEVEATRSELARAEQVFEQIHDRADALRTETKAPARASILRRAQAPTQPVQTLPVKYLGVAAIGGLFAPLALAMLLEQRSRKIGSADQVASDNQLKLYGEVAVLGRRDRGKLSPDNKPRRRARKVFDESIDAVATQLMLSADIAGTRVIAVASATSGEGKTHLAAHLAASLAKLSGERCLLIDADLRAPAIHRMVGASNSRGLADVLKQRCTASEAVVATEIRDLDALVAGPLRGAASAIISSRALQALVEQLRPSYRFIVFDTPPALSASEALIVCRAADATLVCAMRDVSRLVQVQLVEQRLESVGAEPLGLVLCGIPLRQYEKAFGSYPYQSASGGADSADNGAAAEAALETSATR